MMLTMLAAGAIGAPTRLNPVELFLHADIVVQVVMGALGLASVWVWMIVIGFTVRMGLIGRRCRKYEEGFWTARDLDAYQKEQGTRDIPTARVVAAALAEWRRSTSGKTIDRDGTRQRLAAAMDSAVTEETDRLAARLNFLATVGTVAPFVGLFGTLFPHRRTAEFVAGGGRAGDFRSAVCHGHRPGGGNPGGGGLQPVFAPGERV
eukprot:gene7763-7829_t